MQNRGKPEVVYVARGDGERQALPSGEAQVGLTDEAGRVIAILMKAV
jgi:hypothetical protein